VQHADPVAGELDNVHSRVVARNGERNRAFKGGGRRGAIRIAKRTCARHRRHGVRRRREREDLVIVSIRDEERPIVCSQSKADGI
jgi:hypothetical protein